MKRLKNTEDKNDEQLKAIEDKNDKQLKAIEDQKEIQTKIKQPLSKSIYNQEVKDRRINKDAAKKIFKTFEDMERTEIDYSKLVYKSGDKYFNFTKFGPLSSFYLKLMNGDIGIDVVKLNMEEFKKEIDRLEKKKAKKEPYKKIKKMS